MTIKKTSSIKLFTTGKLFGVFGYLNSSLPLIWEKKTMTIIGVAFFALRESFHLLRELQFLTLLFQKKERNERNEFRGKKKLWIFCHFSANLDLTGAVSEYVQKTILLLCEDMNELRSIEYSNDLQFSRPWKGNGLGCGQPRIACKK